MILGMKLLVVIPAWNEQDSIAKTIEAVRASKVVCDFVVVDDGSTDNTAQIAAQSGVKVLQLPFNLGVGGAMRTGFLYAQRHGYEAVVQVDADGQHPPDQIHRLTDALAEADIVIGSRFKDSGSYEVKGPRAWAMRILAAALSRISGTTLTDVTSGFRAANDKAINQYVAFYPVEYLGDTVESLVAAVRSGLKVTEVAVEMQPRRGGEPSHNAMKSTVQLIRSIFALCVALTRKGANERSTA